MPRFNPAKWKPTDDSSPGFRTHDPSRVVLAIDWNDQRSTCPCGCAEYPTGAKAIFRMGHDARLRGKLIRAHLMGREIRYIRKNGDGGTNTSSAMEVAKIHGWEADLQLAEMRREAANRSLVRSALNTTRLIKVGRWDYTGQVAAVYPTAREDVYLIRYVDRAGETKEVRVPASEAPLAREA